MTCQVEEPARTKVKGKASLRGSGDDQKGPEPSKACVHALAKDLDIVKQ